MEKKTNKTRFKTTFFQKQKSKKKKPKSKQKKNVAFFRVFLTLKSNSIELKTIHTQQQLTVLLKALFNNIKVTTFRLLLVSLVRFGEKFSKRFEIASCERKSLATIQHVLTIENHLNYQLKS